MAQGPLVDRQIEDGERLIRALVADNFDVTIAFWAQESEEGLWFLYIASPTVDERGKFAAYHAVQEKMDAIPDLRIGSFDVKLIGRSSRLVKDAEWLRDGSSPTWFGGGLFAEAGIDRGYLYPPIPVGAAS